MAIKVPITTYQNNAAATFWSRLGSFLGFLTPLVILCMILVLLSFPNRGKMHTVLWVLWVILSIAVGIVYFLLTFVLCSLMERRSLSHMPMPEESLRREKTPFPSGAPGAGAVGPSEERSAPPHGEQAGTAPAQTLHPSLQKLAGKDAGEDWEETTIL